VTRCRTTTTGTTCPMEPVCPLNAHRFWIVEQNERCCWNACKPSIQCGESREVCTQLADGLVCKRLEPHCAKTSTKCLKTNAYGGCIQYGATCEAQALHCAEWTRATKPGGTAPPASGLASECKQWSTVCEQPQVICNGYSVECIRR
jgi:hypothetical protein